MEKLTKYRKAIKVLSFLALYTVGFLFLGTALIHVFDVENKSFVWSMDGMAQHLVALKYIRTYILDFLRTGQLTLVDLSIGQGFDVIGTMNYYGFGDPLMLFTIFFPEDSLETMYQFMILLRLYICGISFAYFCYVLGKNKIECVLPASLLYAFCNFALLGGMRHPLFINGMMYLPLLLAGVEKIIKGKKIGFLAIIAAFAFSANYYFMYMNTIMAAIYFFVRLIGSYKKTGVKNLMIYVGKIALSYLWGIGLSAVILFPSVYAFLINSRGESANVEPDVIYQLSYYKSLLDSFFVSFRSVNRWTVPGIGILGCVGACIIIVRWKREERRFLIALAVGMIMLCVPWIGKIMNGFSYVSTRFSYGFALLLSLVLVFAIQDLKELRRKQIIILSVLCGTMCLFCLLESRNSTYPKMYYMAACGILIALVVCVLYRFVGNKKYGKYLAYAFTVIAVLNLTYNFNTIFSSQYHKYCNEFVKKNTVIEKMNNGTIQMLQNIQDDSFYRTDRKTDLNNRTTFYNLFGVTFYYSIIPENIKELYNSNCFSNYSKSFMLISMENRAALQSLASVKYYASNSKKYIPYGFNLIKEETIKGKKTYLFENENVLPLGITYSSYMTRAEYNSLKPEEREQALLMSSVTDQEIAGIDQFDSEIRGIERTEVELIPNNKVELKKNKIIAETGGKIKIKFKGKKNCETYLVISNCTANDDFKDGWCATVKGKYGKGDFRVRGSLSSAYFPRDASIINLGYSEEAQTECSISFPKHREYDYEEIYIACISTKEYEKRISDLKQDTLENTEVRTNMISGTINCSRDEILQLSIPFSSGYNVYVDNQKVNTFSSGIAYTGIKLKKGQHQIKLTYISPGLIEGALVSIISILLFIIYWIFGMIQKKGKSRKNRMYVSIYM